MDSDNCFHVIISSIGHLREKLNRTDKTQLAFIQYMTVINFSLEMHKNDRVLFHFFSFLIRQGY